MPDPTHLVRRKQDKKAVSGARASHPTTHLCTTYPPTPRPHTPSTAQARGRACCGLWCAGVSFLCLMGSLCRWTPNTRLASCRSKLLYWSSLIHVKMMKHSCTLWWHSSLFVSCITIELSTQKHTSKANLYIYISNYYMYVYLLINFMLFTHNKRIVQYL